MKQHRIIVQAHRPQDCIDCLEAAGSRYHRALADELRQYVALHDKQAWEQLEPDQQLSRRRMIRGMIRELAHEATAVLAAQVYALEGNDYQALIGALEAVPEPFRPTADTYGIHYLNRAGDCRKALVLPFPTDVTR